MNDTEAAIGEGEGEGEGEDTNNGEGEHRITELSNIEENAQLKIERMETVY